MEKMKVMTIYGDGVNDDTDALQAYLDGKATPIYPDGTPFVWPGRDGARQKITRTLFVHTPEAARPEATKLPPNSWIGKDGYVVGQHEGEKHE